MSLAALSLVVKFGWLAIAGATHYNACIVDAETEVSTCVYGLENPVAEIEVPREWVRYEAVSQACNAAGCSPWSEGLALRRSSTVPGDSTGDGATDFLDYLALMIGWGRADSAQHTVCTPVESVEEVP